MHSVEALTFYDAQAVRLVLLLLMVAAAGLVYVEFYASTHESQASNVVRLERPRYRTVPFHLREDNSTALDWQEQQYSGWSLTLKHALDAVRGSKPEIAFTPSYRLC